jgi:chromosome segregation protein
MQNLEDTIMKLEPLIPDDDESKKSKKQRAKDTKLSIELKEKENEIRDLKNRMGYLRKEKVQFQQELEKLKGKKSDSIVIRTEDFRDKPPLDTLVKELQNKVNKQKSTIENLKQEYINASEFDDKLKEKEKAIERRMAFSMQTQIDDQAKIIELKNQEIEALINEVDNVNKKFEVFEIQLKIKDQKIKDLSNQKKKKKGKSKKKQNIKLKL